jgi:heme/copper-type cytochrome/quinol oxidase subunit 2
MRLFQLSPVVRWVTLFVVVGLVILFLPVTNSPTPTTHQFTITAQQFEFIPGRIEVNQGDTVVISLSASDVTHGFYLEGYGTEQRIHPGIVQEITFTADQPGKFRYRCSVSCGSLHPFMIGELVVAPNLPFGRATLFVGAALFCYFGYLIRKDIQNEPLKTTNFTTPSASES